MMILLTHLFSTLDFYMVEKSLIKTLKTAEEKVLILAQTSKL
jgi:hypothetical protein